MQLVNDPEEEREKKRNSSFVVELSEYIEQLITERPKTKDKYQYADWKKETNKCIRRCNKLARYKIYDLFE